MNTEMLDAKVNPPAFLTPLVRREAMILQVDKDDPAVVCINAPSGTGKTALLRDLYMLGKAHGNAAWVDVDVADDSDSFWRYVSYSLGKKNAIGEPVAHPSAVLDAIASIDGRVPICINGADALFRQPDHAHETLLFLLRNMPPNMRVGVSGVFSDDDIEILRDACPSMVIVGIDDLLLSKNDAYKLATEFFPDVPQETLCEAVDAVYPITGNGFPIALRCAFEVMAGNDSFAKTVPQDPEWPFAMASLLERAVMAKSMLEASEADPVVRPASTPIRVADRDGAALSARELEVLRLLADGKSVTQIAEEAFISKQTVRTHIKHIYKKLGVHGRKEALEKAAFEHLV